MKRKKVKNNLIGEQRQDKPTNPSKGELNSIRTLLEKTKQQLEDIIKLIENARK